MLYAGVVAVAGIDMGSAFAGVAQSEMIVVKRVNINVTPFLRVSLACLGLFVVTGCGGEPSAPSTSATSGGPVGPHPEGMSPNQSGGQVQDPSGFPSFHNHPAPRGPSPSGVGQFSEAVRVSSPPSGGYRPQIAVGADDTRHVVFYDRITAGDIVRYISSTDGLSWSDPEQVSFSEGRNWGPDIVARDDGSVVVVFDKAEEDFRSRGYMTVRTDSGWSTPSPITPSGAREVGSGHVAHGLGDTVAYVNIGKELGPQHRFRATGRWLVDGVWSAPQTFSDRIMDAWHSNVERRPDGSMLFGYDVGQGGSETTLYLVEGRDGEWGQPEDISATSYPGERPHFAFGDDGVDHVTWFHKERGSPVHIYVRSGGPGEWGPAAEPSEGYGGYHFDPEIEVNSDGVLCLIWGWDSGADAEMLYSLNRGDGWSPPLKIADVDWGKPGLSSIQTDSQGRFHVVWNQGVRGTNEVYYAVLEP